MCGEDGMKRAIYNMKEKHAERERNIKKDTKNTHKEKLRNQRAVLVSKKNKSLCQF